MSLARDFHNYYGNCYVGFRPERNGQLRAFFVTNVNTGRNHNDNDYSDEAVNNLRFSGYYLIDGERREVNNTTLSAGKLELEMPELGYVHRNNRHMYLTFRPQRSMRKGMCGRRVDGCQGNMGDGLAEAIYDSVHHVPDALRRQFAIDDGKLMYKGRRIGLVNGENYDVFVPYRYLGQFVRKAFGENVNVQFVEEEVNA